jgi:hypothetical protein
MSHFDVYGRMARAKDLSNTTQNGRYLAQEHAEQYVPQDIIEKLKPTDKDIFLDIGCGLGLNLDPISKLVSEAHACDHPNVIEKLKLNNPDLSASLFGGSFLEINFEKKYTKMLAYSVLPALPNKDTVYAFVDKALSIMDSSGVTLLGDLANIDKKKRFMDSQRGERFQKEWDSLRSQSTQNENISEFQKPEDVAAVIMDDEFILTLIQHIRKQGFHAYLVDQPQFLPFGNSREDIMIIGPEYKDRA